MRSNIIISRFLSVLLLGVAMASCQDIVDFNDGYDDGLTSTGAPVIEKITTVSKEDSTIVGADMAQMISIYGKNLSGVKSMMFNDVEVDVKTIYAINSRIVLPVPRVLPQNVDNKLTLTTQLGTTIVDFSVVIPDLIVEGLYNEFSKPGDTVEIIGNNFDLYDVTDELGVVELNGQVLPIIAADATTVSVQIPEGTPDNSKLKLSSPRVSDPIGIDFRNKGYTMLYYNEEDGGMWSGDAFLTDGTKSGDPQSLYGVPQFSRVVGSFGQWSWNVPFGGGFNLYDLDIVKNPQDYEVRFEFLTSISKSLSFGNILVGDYSWNPGAGGLAFNTYGQWKTMSFELKDVFKSTDTTPKPVEGWNGYTFVYQPSDVANVDFSFCNLRIVKK